MKMYKFKPMTDTEMKNFKKEVEGALLTAYPDELVDLFNQFTYTKDGMPEILPNEIEYLNDFFEGQPADYILSCLSEDAVLYKRSDEYFAMVDGILHSMRDLNVKDFLKENGYMDALVNFVIDRKMDYEMDGLKAVMRKFEAV